LIVPLGGWISAMFAFVMPFAGLVSFVPRE
jgi:hypothetical protein